MLLSKVDCSFFFSFFFFGEEFLIVIICMNELRIILITNEIKGHNVTEKMRLRSYDNTYEYGQRDMMIRI